MLFIFPAIPRVLGRENKDVSVRGGRGMVVWVGPREATLAFLRGQQSVGCLWAWLLHGQSAPF